MEIKLFVDKIIIQDAQRQKTVYKNRISTIEFNPQTGVILIYLARDHGCQTIKINYSSVTLPLTADVTELAKMLNSLSTKESFVDNFSDPDKTYNGYNIIGPQSTDRKRVAISVFDGSTGELLWANGSKEMCNEWANRLTINYTDEIE